MKFYLEGWWLPKRDRQSGLRRSGRQRRRFDSHRILHQTCRTLTFSYWWRTEFWSERKKTSRLHGWKDSRWVAEGELRMGSYCSTAGPLGLGYKRDLSNSSWGTPKGGIVGCNTRTHIYTFFAARFYWSNHSWWSLTGAGHADLALALMLLLELMIWPGSRERRLV